VGDWIEKGIADPRRRHLYRMVIELMILGFAAVFFYYSLRLTILALDVTNVFAIPKRVLYSCMPVAGVFMVIYSLRNIAVEMIGIANPTEGEG
jgi:TRAP-type C4-dicarboxylate transport system permease small subunit